MMLVSQRPQHVTRDKECYTAGKLSFASVKGWSSKRIIGKGAFGEVFAVATQGGFEVAVKAQKLTENTVSSILKEVEYLKLVQGHDNVIAFYDEKIKHGKKHTIMTELALCNFYRIVSKGGPMAPHMAKRFAKQLLDGVDHIHSCGIAHNDLKLENLLLGNDGFLKIADFGLALPYVDFEDRDDGYFEYSGFIGTKVTAAPEVVQGSSKFAPVKNDIWACGVIIMEFLTGRPGLWQQASLEDPAFQHFIEDRISPLTGQDDEFIRFILQIDPKKRPLIFRILKHSWFQNGSRKRSSSCSSSEDEDEIYAKKGRR